MFGGITFYLYKDKIELCGRMFSAGELTADLLNCSQEDYAELNKLMQSVECMTLVYQKKKDKDIWFQLNERLEALSQRLRQWRVFQLIVDDLKDDVIFSETRELVQNYSLFPDEDYDFEGRDGELSEVVARWLAAKKDRWQYEEELDAVLDQGRIEREAREDENLPTPPALLVYPGNMEDKWKYYGFVIGRYKSYLCDISVFNPTIHNFLNFMLERLEVNSPENYAKQLYLLHNDERLNQKLIPINTEEHTAFWQVDLGGLSFVPRETEDGKFTIAQEYVTDSLQMLMKADFMTGLNAGHKIHRCRVCKKYFLVQGGYHVQYCEGRCPYAPQFTCRQFGSYKIQKELAGDIPKLNVKVKAIQRISKDLQRENITEEDAEAAKRYVTDQLYDALNMPDISVDEFKKQVSSAVVYHACGITRKAKPRGRPGKEIEGGTDES